METGDRIIKIEGVMSGTLSYIFNSYRGGMRFSDVVADAKHKGYTEPDPREDLSGKAHCNYSRWVEELLLCPDACMHASLEQVWTLHGRS